MSHATEGKFASKKAFAAHVAANGADNVYVLDTSAFVKPADRRVSVASLAGSTAVIVGPDAHNDRRWYANVKVKTDRATKSKVIVIA